jgi:hypothetical protein
MKYGNADEYPAQFVSTRNLLQFRFNVHAVSRVDLDDKPHASYDYDYVEVVDKTDLADLKDTIVSESYSTGNLTLAREPELALIKARLATVEQAKAGTAEYDRLQAYKAEAESIVATVTKEAVKVSR